MPGVQPSSLTDFLDEASLVHGLCVFMRISAALLLIPIFGEPVVSVWTRIFFGLVLTFMLLPLLPASAAASTSPSLVLLAGWCIGEILLGLSFGFLTKIFIEGVVMAAAIVGYQMGFGTASLLMPGGEGQASPLSALHRILILMIFLGLNLHYTFVYGLIQLLTKIPAPGGIISVLSATSLAAAMSASLTVAMQLAAPILVALLLTMAALGLVARTVPQVNVFTLSFPVSFFTGMLIYVVMLRNLPHWLNDLTERRFSEIMAMALAMGYPPR